MTAPPRQEMLAVDTARWLVSDAGRGAVATAARELRDGNDLLAVVTALRQGGLPAESVSAAVTAARARLRAAERYDDAEDLLFTLSGLEQASHPRVAAWRSQRLAGHTAVWDLCCGEGGDTLAIATRVRLVAALDQDAARLVLARHNVAARALPARLVLGDARRPPHGEGHLVHVDPGRRTAIGRARRLAHYEPPVASLAATLDRARGAAVVLSPAVDLAEPDLPAGAELEFVQVGRRLVEAVAWTKELARPGTLATATILDPDGGEGPVAAVRHRAGPVTSLPVLPAGEWLLEPAPASVRARLHDDVGAEAGAWRLATRRALLSTDREPSPSPWWRAWQVEASLPAQARHVRDWLRAHDELPVAFSTHGFEVDVDAFWRALGSPPRGPQGRRVHLVRLDDGARAYVCRSQTRDVGESPD